MGLFIVLEGIDGCGKGTQAIMLANKLVKMSKRHHVVMTREPGRSDYGSALRKIMKEETDPYSQKLKIAKLFVDDRRHHVKGSVNPALDYGSIVVCDRYKHSTLTYQETQGVAFDELVKMHDGLPVPDLTVIIDIPAELGLKRISKDSSRAHKESFEQDEFQRKLRSAYLQLPSRLADENIVIINGEKTPEAIHNEIMSLVTPLLHKVA